MCQSLPSTGYLRLSQIIGRKPNTAQKENNPPNISQPSAPPLTKRRKKPQEAIPALIPISKSTWWQGVRDGRFPQPIKFGSRMTLWRVEEILNLIEQGIPNNNKKSEMSK